MWQQNALAKLKTGGISKQTIITTTFKFNIFFHISVSLLAQHQVNSYIFKHQKGTVGLFDSLNILSI